MQKRKVPDIVRELIEEEKLDLLQSKTINFHDSVTDFEPLSNEEDDESKLISYESIKSDDYSLANIGEIYRIIFENSSFGITIVDIQERIVSWNKHAEELLNLTENELYLKPAESLYPVEEWEKIREENVRQKGIKYRMETKMIRKDYGPFDVEISLCVLKGEDGKNVGTIGIIKDISKMKTTQNKLDDAEERFKTIFNNSAVAITVTNSEEQITSLNNYAEQLLGYSQKDILMKHVSILYPPEEWEKIRAENIRKKGMQHHLETKIICGDKKEIDVDISLSVLKNYEGNIIGSIGIIRDITERKHIEGALEQSEEKFRELYHNAPIPYHTLSPDGSITDVNDKWCQVLGYNKEDVIGKTIFDFISKDEQKDAKNSFRKKIKSKKLYTGGHERTLLTKTREKRIFIINDFFSFDSFDEKHNIKSIHTTMEDITDRKKIEKDLNISLKNQEIITKISRLFNGLEDFNTKMNKSLDILGKSTNVSRAYVFEDYNEGKMTSNTYEWCNEGIESQIDNLQDVPYETVPSFKKILTQRGVINFSDIKELPKDIYDVFAPHKIKSILILPLIFNEEYYGFLGFDECIEHNKWNKNEVELIRTIAQIYTTSYQKKKADDKLKKQTNALAEANVRAAELVDTLKKSGEDLKNKVDELERYKKITVDREIKMIELKKRIKEFENSKEVK